MSKSFKKDTSERRMKSPKPEKNSKLLNKVRSFKILEEYDEN